MDVLIGESILNISQELDSLVNGVNCQIKSSTAISERIIPQTQGVVEAVLGRQLESEPVMSRRSRNSENDVRNQMKTT